jgi:hypothetical protein
MRHYGQSGKDETDHRRGSTVKSRRESYKRGDRIITVVSTKPITTKVGSRIKATRG